MSYGISLVIFVVSTYDLVIKKR